MRVWIPTMAGDFHSATIALELESRGHDVTLFYGEDYPEGLVQSARIGSSLCEIQVGDSPAPVAYDVSWNRRRIAFSMPHGLHEDDVEFVRGELRACSDGIWANAAIGAYWINPLEAAANARHKLSQLRIARGLGFAVPETLMSNDPEAVRDFVREYGSVVYKSFKPGYWQSGEDSRSLLATLITENDLQHDAIARRCPGIYQSLVKRQFEVRATVFGRTIMAIRIHPSKGARTIDYREGHLVGLVTEPFELPSNVQEMLFAFMDASGLRFGCFDLIFAGDGRYYFLEVNEAGQFLWLEDLQPSVTILDAFCSFLEAMDDGFEYRGGAVERSLASWRRSGRPERLMRPALAPQRPLQPAEV